MSSTAFRVGPRRVAGVEPGGTLRLDVEHTALDVPALVAAGHLTPLAERQRPDERKKGRPAE